MESHVYSTHIKNKNALGFVVDGVPYYTLYEAEEACMKLGVPPDRENLIHDPKEACRLAKVVYPEMMRIKSSMESILNKARKELDKVAKELESYGEHPKDLMDQVNKELAEEKLHEALGKSEQACENYLFISDQCSNLYKVICLKVTERVKNDE